MKIRASERLSSLLSLLLLLGLAAGTYYLAEKSAQFDNPNAKAAAAHEPDSFVDGLVVTKVNARGEPVFRLSSRHMVHIPLDNRTDYEAPLLVSLDTDKPQVTLRALRARASGDGEVTELFDQVELVREAGKGEAGRIEPRVRITSDSMTLYSPEEIARTTDAVKIEYASSVLTGVGMEFNHATRQFALHGNVRGTYVTPPK